MFWCRVLILACTLGSYRELVKNIAWPCARVSVLIPLGPGEAEDPAWGVLESTLGDSVRRIDTREYRVYTCFLAGFSA